MTLERSWRFDLDGVHGYVSGGGEHGVEITEAPGRTPATRRLCFNLEHYLAADRGYGEFVPRERAPVEAERAGPRTVRVTVEPHDDWPVRATLELEPRADRAIEARYAFAFDEDVDGFEAFVSNYFHDPAPPFLYLDGEWTRPALGDAEHRFWTASPEDRRRTRDLYPDPFVGLDANVAAAALSRAVMATPIPNSEWTVVHAVEPEGCASLSANRRFNAHDLSLVGQDAAAGETVRCRAWLWLTDGGLDTTLERLEMLVED